MNPFPSNRAGTIATALRYELPNGMVALVQRNATAPTVSVYGEVRVGAANEPPEKNGLSAFTGAALIRGAGHRTFQEIVARTEAVGASVNAGGGMHSTGFAGRSLNEDVALILEILSDMVRAPMFPDEEIERLRGQFLMALREDEQDTSVRASRALRSIMFPPTHPYSRLSRGTIETISTLTREDLLQFHTLYHPAATTIAVVGDIDPAAVMALIERFFGDWQAPGAPPRVTLPDPLPLPDQRRVHIALDGKSQTDVIWAVHGLDRRSPDYYAASVANMILGQLGIGGRLGERVREEQGLAYYCGSSLDADLGAGPWTAMAGVNPAHVERAIDAIVREIKQFAAEGPTEQELADARDFMTGRLAIGLETNDSIASTLLGIERYQLGLDYIERYPAIISSIDRDQVVEVARRYLATDDYAIVTAGPPASSSVS
ncbi:MULTISPECIES: M16 family metallopeptidase [unclassified Roseiflexus]|jgi:zinc protease|uniref:M16 family metallopeptidase n=1 Tax=unclassified Roseiflexus TaxID=2609473 RepID=UPI00030F9C94|nr:MULTISPECIES: pitrilysin family protein [unclassified Roseiflexus]MBO9322735.1 insulinase family protein [Roseiflexus sp.]MCL6541613.1 insulinase family protein [Roseiflexus sp.]